MSQSRLFLSVNQSCAEALHWVDNRIQVAGMESLHTFDLKVAQSSHGECSCPHHGTSDCNCQVVFLLIYHGQNHLKDERGEQPLCLMVHGHDEQTWVYIVDSPQQRPDPHLEAKLRQTLIPALQDGNQAGLSPAI